MRLPIWIFCCFPGFGIECILNGYESFSTGGHTVYHLDAGIVQNSECAIVSASFDGTAMCHSIDGSLIWENPLEGHFPFDLHVSDIDGDGLDETLVATGAGKLYVLDENGELLWQYDTGAPLFQVCTAGQDTGNTVVLTGGVGQTLYALSANGVLLGTLDTVHIVRHLGVGDILGKGKDYLAVATTDRGLSGILSLMLVDPEDLSVVWRKTRLGSQAYNSGRRFFSMAILDLNGDRMEDILLSNSWGENGKIFAFNQDGESLYTASDPAIPKVSYRMNLLDPVILDNDRYVIGHFGNVIIRYNLDGSLRDVTNGPYSFADGVFDPVTKSYIMGSSVSGGDGIYVFSLNNPNWLEDFKNLKPIGKLKAIEDNIRTLILQIEKFEPPVYQPKPKAVTVLSRRPGDADAYKNLSFVDKISLSQGFKKQDELWNRKIDGRQKYMMTADEIIEHVRQRESLGRDFSIWAGHGHAVYMPLDTLKRVVDAAPEHLWGFEFAEMEGVDEHMQEVVEQILLPLAEYCRQNNKKIIFRNKNIFWNGTSYVPYWRRVLLDSGFEDVFIPTLEETNCRTAELSLSGRMGLWMTGSFNQWSCRMTTDNANFDRMWEWAGQQVLNHHFRHLVSRASLGADVYFNNISQGPFSGALYSQLEPFYDMLEKGIVQIPGQDELLSVPDVCIGLKSPPSEEYIRHGTNGHQYRYREDTHPMLVFDSLDCYWAGSPIKDHDFSGYGLGAERRMCNFLPVWPNGLVPIVPDDTEIGDTRFKRKISTDGQFYFDDAGKQVSANKYKDVVESLLQVSAERLPVRVTGDGHWSVVRIDATHVRITLVDPGYLDPSCRNVEIILQHLDGVECRDILSREVVPIRGNRIAVSIPMGTFRILDIEHR